MADSTYNLRLADHLSLHLNQSAPFLLRDSDQNFDEAEIEAMVDSEDCFINIATQINEAVRFLISDPKDASPELQKIVRTLFYLQRNYRLIRK